MLSLRHTLTLRDAFNQQSYEINKLYKSIKSANIEENEMLELAKKENEVLELAEKLGVKIHLGDK